MLGKHLDFFCESFSFLEGKKLIHSFHNEGINFEWKNLKNWFGMPQCMKLQHCTYNKITEVFQLWECIESGTKSEKQTFNKKIPFRINCDHW